jgi:hypothetical protein
MKNAAVGFRVHSGWTSLVVVSLEKREPIVLSRQRLQLVNTFSYKFRQPYHTAERIGGKEAANFVSMARKEAEALAIHSLRAIKKELASQEFQLDRGALLLASGRVLPEFKKILLSHALIHTADGELFRAALRKACHRRDIKLMCIKERELLENCASSFSMNTPDILRTATQLGKPYGAPWSQDEKLATLAAWLALSDR